MQTIEQIHFREVRKKIPADLITPLQVYLRIRDKYPESCLLESNDHSNPENSRSIIAFGKRLSIGKDAKGFFREDHSGKLYSDHASKSLGSFIKEHMQSILVKNAHECNGWFGYLGFESGHSRVSGLQDLIREEDVPLMRYVFYRFVVVFDHFHNTAELIENTNEEGSQLEEVALDILSGSTMLYPFHLKSEEQTTCCSEDFLKRVERAKFHVLRGDVFQLVLSRLFLRQYAGDDFAIYRSLRSISPSPYLFYFDCGDFRLMGSSPESQILIQNGSAEISPIAGTFARHSDEEKNKMLLQQLMDDPKENAEHNMLVDLARNDLNRHCENVRVSELKKVKKFSHVLHLVSKVTGDLQAESNSVDVLLDAFPAGTLSGAPKVRAMQLIADIEGDRRGFYGGAIGLINLQGDVLHAILIRSVLCKNGQLHYRAGAGIVRDSVPENELAEIDNKLRAVRMAIQQAQFLQA
jgi:anthranilate synthase component 1